jgi:hypothetical protein
MKVALALSARWLQLLYSLMLLVVGFVGIWTARTELERLFHLQPSSWTPDVAATVLNQYRFLKAVECGSGIFCILFRADIMAGGRHAAVFTAIVSLGIFARSVAWIADGRPHPLFIGFLVLEILVLAVFVLNARVTDDA